MHLIIHIATAFEDFKLNKMEYLVFQFVTKNIMPALKV